VCCVLCAVCHTIIMDPLQHSSDCVCFQFTWAIVADIDIESEKWRCCGGARFTWGGIVRALCLRKYQGTLWYLPANTPDVPAPATIVTAHPGTGESKADDAIPHGVSSGLRHDRVPISFPPLSHPLPEGWQVRVLCRFC
jgi:hypothetical protein